VEGKLRELLTACRGGKQTERRGGVANCAEKSAGKSTNSRGAFSGVVKKKKKRPEGGTHVEAGGKKKRGKKTWGVPPGGVEQRSDRERAGFENARNNKKEEKSGCFMITDARKCGGGR